MAGQAIKHSVGDKVLYRRDDGLADIGIITRIRAFFDITEGVEVRQVWYTINNETINENQVL